MSMAACEAFWREKVAQAEKVVADRYPLLRRVERTPRQWAEDHAAEQLEMMTQGLKVADAHWMVPEFNESFKAAVLKALRAWMEICKQYDAALRLQEEA